MLCSHANAAGHYERFRNVVIYMQERGDATATSETCFT
jgi:hypothetical protein